MPPEARKQASCAAFPTFHWQERTAAAAPGPQTTPGLCYSASMESDAIAEDGLPLWPAPERNKQPISEQLELLLADVRGVLLEIASATGQHALYFASRLPWLDYVPSDLDPEHLGVLRVRVEASALPNLRPPLDLDVTRQPWPIERADAIYCANMIHIAPPEATLGLLGGAARLLPSRGLLITYGPYQEAGVHTAPSNAQFDRSLRERNSSWGVRDLVEVRAAAEACGLALEQRINMPANNQLLVWRRK